MGNKKILMVISQMDFRDEEYFLPQSIFKEAGFEVLTCAEKKGQSIGVYGGVADIELEITNINPQDFEAIVFVGGPGAAKNINNKKFHQLAKDFIKEGKVIGAICIAPAILATAGILSGKKATAFTSTMDKSAVKILEASGAIYLPEKIVSDGNIITAVGPEQARKFAETIVRTLNNP